MTTVRPRPKQNRNPTSHTVPTNKASHAVKANRLNMFQGCFLLRAKSKKMRNKVSSNHRMAIKCQQTF
eukprot:1160666-Pelagomonas_calceolata.AAC.3